MVGNDGTSGGDFIENDRIKRNAIATRKKQGVKRGSDKFFLLILLTLTIAVVVEIMAIDYFLGDHEVLDLERAANGTSRIVDPGKDDVKANSFHSDNSKEKLNLDQALTEPLDTILRRAGIDVTEEIRRKLPPLSEVHSMYGSRPVSIGFDRCENFRSTTNSEKRLVGPAGMVRSFDTKMFVIGTYPAIFIQYLAS